MNIKWDFKDKYSFEDKKFCKIYDFFVIKTPIDAASVRGISFKKRNINLIEMCNIIKKESESLKHRWEIATKKQMPEKLKEYNIFDNNIKMKNVEEVAIHTKNSKYNLGKTESFFYCIRCAFAHGAFSIRTFNKNRYYILENKDKGVIKGRIIIKESTLLNIIKYCEDQKKG